jgi:hypothetical protein
MSAILILENAAQFASLALAKEDARDYVGAAVAWREAAALEPLNKAWPVNAVECELRANVKPLESRPHSWDELTCREQAECNFRGFPRGADIRYILKSNYKDNEAWALVRWTRQEAR